MSIDLPMKKLGLAAAILLALSTHGSSCVNESATISINLKPIVGRYRIGPGTTFAGVVTVSLDTLIGTQYRNKIRQTRIYDFRVWVEGHYTGMVSGFVAIKVGNREAKPMLRFPGNGTVAWSSLLTPQSLLGKSPHLAPQPEGISELLSALAAFPPPEISVLSFVTLSLAPVPENLYVQIVLYVQADAEL